MEQSRHPLAMLIDQVRDANGWSDTDIARRATAAGHKLGKSNLSRIRTTEVVSITASTIRSLAAGLGIPETEVARAALASMRIDMPDLSALDLETVVKVEPTLSVRDKQMLLSILSTMRSPGATSARYTFTTRPLDEPAPAAPRVKAPDAVVVDAPAPVSDDEPTFDRSRMLAAMAEPDSDHPATGTEGGRG